MRRISMFCMFKKTQKYDRYHIYRIPIYYVATLAERKSWLHITDVACGEVLIKYMNTELHS